MISRNTLKRIEALQLMQLLQSEFKTHGGSDETFAAMATERLGFKVNDRNVHGLRVELGIEPNLRPGRLTILDRLDALEARLSKLEKEWQS